MNGVFVITSNKVLNPFKPNRATDPIKAIEYIRYVLSLENYKLLSNKFKNAFTPLLVQCNRNHPPYPTNWNTLHRGSRCQRCKHENQKNDISLKKPFSNIRAEAKRLQLSPLFNEKEYTNSHDRMPYKCLKCGDVSRKSFSNIKAGKRCRKCAVKDFGFKQRHSFSGILKEAEKIGLMPLFLEEEYLSKRFDHPYLCIKCGEIIWKSPTVVKKGHGCQTCSAKYSGIQKRLSIKEIKDDATRMNLKIIGGLENYRNRSSTIHYQCLSCRKEIVKRPGDVRDEKGCPNCSSGISERICREYFSKILDSDFPNSRPHWLINDRGNQMSLDGYSEELRIAFEHNGEQHYSLRSHFISSEKILRQRKLDDARKIELCGKNGVVLIVVPELGTRTPRHELQSFIISKLREAGVKVPKLKEKLKIVPGSKSLFIDQAKTYARNISKVHLKIQISDWMGLRNPIEHKCTKCGYRWFRQAISLHNMKGCPKCAGNAQLTKEAIVKIVEGLGAVMQGGVPDNQKSRIKVKCKAKEHSYEGRIYDFQKSWASGCPTCRLEKKRNKIIGKIDSMLAKRNLKRIGPYINANVPIKVQCVKCNEIYNSKYHTIFEWERNCRNCK